MIVPERLAERIENTGVSYTALAKKLGVKQPTITRLVKGEQRSTARIDLLASALETTPAYLCGETDDPGADAPPPPPPSEHHVFMRVALPPEEALEAMFRGLLRSMPDLAGDDLARELAKLLPTGFEQLQGPLRYERRADDAAHPAADQGRRDDDRGRRRA